MPSNGRTNEDDATRSEGGADGLVRAALEEVLVEDSEISRRRLLAVLGGTAGAGAALAAGPAMVGAESALIAAKKAKEVGQPKSGANSLELLGRINQNGTGIDGFGYLTRISGLSDGKLFTQPRGVKFNDPKSTTPSTARFTFRTDATIKALSATDNVITALGNGTFRLFYQANGGANFPDHSSFNRGKEIAKYKLSFQDNLITRGSSPGANNSGEATVYLTGKLVQRSASEFKIDGKKTVIGEKGLDLRLEALGSGELFDAAAPLSVIFVVGSLVAVE